jgi:hypothetical protein
MYDSLSVGFPVQQRHKDGPTTSAPATAHRLQTSDKRQHPLSIRGLHPWVIRFQLRSQYLCIRAVQLRQRVAGIAKKPHFQVYRYKYALCSGHVHQAMAHKWIHEDNTRNSGENYSPTFIWYDPDRIESQKIMWGYTDSKVITWASCQKLWGVHRQQGDLMSLLTKIMGDIQTARWSHEPPDKNYMGIYRQQGYHMSLLTKIMWDTQTVRFSHISIKT